MDTVVVALRVVLSLAVVLGLLWVLQRRLSRGPGKRTANVVTIVGRQGLGQKASVVVVDVDGRRFVLGVTEQSINVLHGGEAEPEAHRTGHQTPDDRSAAFARSLHAASGGPTLVPPVLVPLRAESPVASGEAEAEPLDGPPLTFRPRRDRSATGRLGGSILSPSTWQQTAALLRHGR
ncbi:flagellar biosynthetic protein FliO [Cryobacterium soli]|uniref:flagellar biosynthetic protein FliO n=1 Tax=Cryobacterium soli TaxID=2220095 RepID=UPI000E72B99D|nr:flagellar biosynthetic protein FliO [Cryobacterium soli]